jgi:Mg-chelatase subunit ChlD
MKNKKDNLSVFVALDRSGSMAGERWTTAIESLNSYMIDLQKESIDGDVTIVAFDATHDVNQARAIRFVPLTQDKSISKFKSLKSDVLEPAGMTPLYDAAAHVMDLALTRNADRTIVVILTDGDENSSIEYTQEKIKNKVKTLQDKGWEVIFLGANFDVAKYAQGSGLAGTKMRNVNFGDAQMVASMTMDLSSNSIMYAKTGGSIDMSVAVKK